MNLLSGNVKLPNGNKLPILWTGQNAQHLANRYTESHSLHPVLHIEAQQILSGGKPAPMRNNKWLCFKESNEGGIYVAFFVKHPSFAEIKSCIFINQTMEQVAKKYRISGPDVRAGKKYRRVFDVEAIQYLADLAEVPVALLEKTLNKAMDAKKRSRKK